MRFSWNLALGHVSRLDSWFPIDLELKCWLIWLNLAKKLIFFKNGKNSLKKKKICWRRWWTVPEGTVHAPPRACAVHARVWKKWGAFRAPRDSIPGLACACQWLIHTGYWPVPQHVILKKIILTIKKSLGRLKRRPITGPLFGSDFELALPNILN